MRTAFLEEYDEFNIGTAFRKAAQASIAYTLSVRCTEEGENLFEPEDFRDVSDFNTRQTAAALGTAVSSISREVFREIERAIRDYERTKAQERSQNYAERNNIQAGRGLSSAGDRVERDHRETSGQIRENAQGISEGEQSDTLQRSGTGGEVFPHLQEIDETAHRRLDQLMKELLEKNPAPDKKLNQMGWVRHLNSLKAQAEEIILAELINN